jgi:hypothetical protein
MALPRPALLGILGAVLVLVAFVATHKVGKGSSSNPAPVSASKPKQAAAEKAAPSPAKHAAARAKQVAAKHTTATKSRSVKVNVPAGNKAGASVGLPAKVAQAFAQHRVVVLYFGGPGADDALTAQSVRALKASSGRGVAVFMDKLSNLADYRRVVEGLDVSQAPSIVIVDRAKKAQVLEGFIDAGSLRQDVADVAR